MKRIVNIVLMGSLLLLLTVPALAADKSYYLDDVGMSIFLSKKYDVMTKETKEGRNTLEENTYLSAKKPTSTWLRPEIMITMEESQFEDFNAFSEESLQASLPSLTERYESQGMTCLRSSIYYHQQTKFIETYLYVPGKRNDLFCLQYFTVYNGKEINVRLQSYFSQIDTQRQHAMRSVIDTIHFDTPPQIPPLPLPDPVEAHMYTNEYMSFTISDNWTENFNVQKGEHFEEQLNFITLDGTASISVACMDWWNKLTQLEKAKYSREELSSSLNEESVAEMLQCKETEISIVTFAEQEYFYAKFIDNQQVDGITVEVPIIMLIRSENGYLYEYGFSFSEIQNEEYYRDFESLISSVVYTPGNTYEFPWSWTDFVISICVTICIYSLPIIIYRYMIVKKPVEEKKAKQITIIYGIIGFVIMSVLIFALNGSGVAGSSILLWSWVNYRILVSGTQPENQQVQESPYVEEVIHRETGEKETKTQPVIRFCYQCGNKLIPNSRFCDQCGTKVPERIEK